MVPMPIQILRWLMQPFVWRFVGFGSAIVGLLCYALSSSFNHLFRNWNLLKIFLYIAFSFIISLLILYAEKWQHSRSLRFKAHSAFLVSIITTVFSFFSDKVMNGKPDAYSLISCDAFAIMSLSLSRQTQCGFEVDLLYFFLGCLTVQLMKIKFELVIVGAGFSYSLIILRSSFSAIDAAPENEYVGLQDIVIEVENSKVIGMLLNEVKDYLDGTSELVVTDHNFVIDALPSERFNDLYQTVKIMVSAGFEKECTDVFSNWRREWILFPNERRLYDRVFSGFSSAADRFHRAIKVQNRLGEASRDLFLDFDNLIFRVPTPRRRKLLRPMAGIIR
ncbi:Cullin repeat-like-containing domain superfamily [Sesbania bispinosa]|nr:Cullin repeat-like-containing domain superfamily [Sesbania bispinosa]